MADVTIYHNPHCSKSRQTLQLLQDRGIEPEIVEYLKSPPDAATLKDLLQKLGLEAADLVRNKEDEYEELGLEGAGDERLIQAMAENPILIERPIVVKGDRARLGRPPENALELL